MKQKTFVMLACGAMLSCGVPESPAQETGKKLPKKGGICFRFDDNQSIERWRKMAAVFEKHGFRFSMAINAKQAAEIPGYGKLLHDMAAKGYEVMDHTPEHTVIRLALASEETARKLAQEPFVDHVTGNTVYFKFYFDAKNPEQRPLTVSVTGGKWLTVSQGKIENGDYSKYLVFPDGKIYLLNQQNGKPCLYSRYGEDNVNCPDCKDVKVLLASRNAFHVDDRALALVAKRTKELFAGMGVPAPRTFITPGGWGLYPKADQLQRVYGKEFGYAAGDQFYSYPATYSGKALDRFRMAPYWNSLETNSVEREKELFADLLARNYVIPVISHMWLHGVNNNFETLLQRNDAFLAWVKEKKIPVHNMAEWADILYGGKVDPYGNIFPSFAADLDGNGRPDGFNMEKGAVCKDGVFSGSGALFYIAGLTGFERGENLFRVEAKKTGPKTAEGLLIFWFLDEKGKQYPQQTVKFTASGDDFRITEGRFTVPEYAAAANVLCMFCNTPGAIRRIEVMKAPQK